LWQVHLFVTLISIIRSSAAFFSLLFLSAHGLAAGLGSYPHLVVGDSLSSPRNGVRVTYLGTNGYQFEFKGHALLVDPYFSRVDLLSVALGSRIQPNAARINDGLRHLASGNCDGRYSGDATEHFDHLLDVPAVMAKTRARLIASASSVDLVPAAAGRGAHPATQ